MSSESTITDADRLGLEVRVSRAFRPAAPIDRAALFAGRREEIRTVLNAVSQTGQHVVIYGERGVGKTSLANVLTDMLKIAGLSDFITAKVHCDVSDDFTSVWLKLLQEVEISLPVRQMGFLAGTELQKFSLSTSMGAAQEITPHMLRRALRELNLPVILIVDEFDRLEEKETPRLFADTIKALSDYGVTTTLILVGVARDIDELIEQHASVDRTLVQVKLPRMSEAELVDILDKAAAESGITIDIDAKRRIAALSKGLPHYTHLLGLAAARKALDEKRTRVKTEDVRDATKTAVSSVQQSILSRYNDAVTATKESLYKQVLLACALAPVDPMGTFNAVGVRQPMTIIMERTYTTAHFFRHLNEFCSESRGYILEKTGHRKTFRYTFRDPLMQPFIILNGLATGLLSEEKLARLSSN